jgi:amino acid permease
MKTASLIKRYSFMALLTILILLSVTIALITYRYYGVVARGILGIILIYLLYYFGKSSNMDVSTDTLLSDPKKGKYLISAFVVPLISYWAVAQIFEMILFFWKR